MYKNRLLEFRAWSQKKKEFYFTPFHIIGETTVFDLLNQWKIRIEDLDDLIITQNTGIKDSDGKPVYEGDVVDVLFQKAGRFQCRIEYSGLEFEFVVTPEEKYSIPMSIKDNVLELKVIGNIFQQPEFYKDYTD